MNIAYDPKYNIAYLTLRARKPKRIETIQLSDEVNIDIAPDGTLYGIELLNANEQLGNGTKRIPSFTLSNVFTGERVRLPLAA